ncbi:MAG: PadR family transcriptional regulator [Gammaproteobacteria bacterium]|nr:PadR family transcriptional regulator [Gammaproteobacteria bacterium]
MLTDGAASGYDLKKQFESSFGHFFAAGFGSIYPALSSLADSGLVTCTRIPQDGKPDRKVYAITAEGREHLLHTLDNSEPSHKVRSEFLATLCFSHLMSDDQVQRIFDHRLAEVCDYLNMFDEIESNGMQDLSAGMQFVVGFSRAMNEARQKYISEHRHMLANDNPVSSATG